MKHRNAAGLLAAAGMALCALSPAKAAEEVVHFKRGASSASLSGAIRGDGEISGNFVDGGRL